MKKVEKNVIQMWWIYYDDKSTLKRFDFSIFLIQSDLFQ